MRKANTTSTLPRSGKNNSNLRIMPNLPEDKEQSASASRGSSPSGVGVLDLSDLRLDLSVIHSPGGRLSEASSVASTSPQGSPMQHGLRVQSRSRSLSGSPVKKNAGAGVHCGNSSSSSSRGASRSPTNGGNSSPAKSLTQLPLSPEQPPAVASPMQVVFLSQVGGEVQPDESAEADANAAAAAAAAAADTSVDGASSAHTPHSPRYARHPQDTASTSARYDGHGNVDYALSLAQAPCRPAVPRQRLKMRDPLDDLGPLKYVHMYIYVCLSTKPLQCGTSNSSALTTLYSLLITTGTQT